MNKRNKPVRYNLSGQRFGKLLVLSLARCKKTLRTAWLCKCDCGTEKVILSQNLRGKKTSSCGCGNGLATSERLEKKLRKGARFGKLKVIKKYGQNRWGSFLYDCKCDCGKIHRTKSANLRSGKTRSCGCGQLAAVTTHGLSYTYGYAKAAAQKRRALKKKAGGAFSVSELEILWKTQGGLCFYCRKKLKHYHLDHKIPLSRGGTNYITNICFACPTCNLKKHNKTDTEFREKMRCL